MAGAVHSDSEQLRELLEEAVRTKRISWSEADQIWKSKTYNDVREKEDEYFQRSMIDNFGLSANVKRAPPVRAAPAPNPNDIASLVTPLSQLKPLWTARWGEQWVTPKDMDATEDVAFWWNAFQRLLQQNCFEVYIMGTVEWRRLKEENGNS